MHLKNCIFAAYLAGVLSASADQHEVTFDSKVDRAWGAPELWTNPMEDWRLKDGLLRNTHSGGNRNVVLLNSELTSEMKDFVYEADLKTLQADGVGFVGLQVGLQGKFDDYRDSAIYGSGLNVGVLNRGALFIGSPTGEANPEVVEALKKGATLKFSAKVNGEQYDCQLDLIQDGKTVASVTESVHPSWLEGLASFVSSSQLPPVVKLDRVAKRKKLSQKSGGEMHCALGGLRLSGDKVKVREEREFGPIFWAQHSLDSDGTFRLLVQMAPIGDGEKTVELKAFKETYRAEIEPNSRTAVFTIREVDTKASHPYEISYEGKSFKGTLRAEPIEKEELVIASLSCNDSTGFPHNQLVGNVSAQKPDLIAFLGDQIYEPIGGYGVVWGPNDGSHDDRSSLCYLRKYAMHGWTWREMLSEVPTVTIPDDHDVLHGNVWGAGGKRADRSNGIYAGAQDSGGFKMSVPFVNAVFRSQTGNLPDPVDPKPCESGINVYFTDWTYAGVDMAILADRQFKSAPKALLPESQISNGWPKNKDFQRPALKDPKEALDHPEAKLLGDRQIAFLEKWSEQQDAQFKVVLSATPFTCIQTIPEDKFSDGVVPSLRKMKPGEYPENDIPKLDYDANGWPQTGRDKAVSLLTKAHAVHLAGDQHLGSTGQYGRGAFNDSAWWIASPAIANLWPRRWFPKDGGANRREGDPKYTGEFFDGFGNRMTLHAASNPLDIDREPSRLYDKAVGYSLVKFNRKAGTIEMACWPYWASPVAEEKLPYPGWPITIDPKTNKRIK